MYYKIILNNTIKNYSSIYNIIKSISKFFIIINPSLSYNYYIIYLILENTNNFINLTKLTDIKIIKYSKVIYKIYYYYLLNYNNSIHYLLIDYTVYNLIDLTINNKLSLDSYLNIFNINNMLKKNLSNYIRSVNHKIIWIYHNNNKYLNFIKNYILSYKQSNESNHKQSIININDYNHFTSYKNLKYIIINLKNKICDIDLIKESINIFYNKLIFNSYKLYKKINYKVNILILSNSCNTSEIINRYISYFTFSKLIT
jgi:hypothetical protein